MASNQYANKITAFGQVKLDLSNDTISPDKLLSGETAHDASGAPIIGTYIPEGGSSYTLIGEQNVTVSSTSTSGATCATITVNPSAWIDDAIIYVRVRDTAGPRLGYFYGSDSFFINTNKANNGSSAMTTGARMIHRYSTSGQWGQYVGATTTGYGVYAYSITTAGKINMYRRYNSNYSLTIDGTYHVEVYRLDFPDKVSPFD